MYIANGSAMVGIWWGYGGASLIRTGNLRIMINEISSFIYIPLS
jgi:hypothetical protein